MLSFIYPSDYLNPKKIDESFLEESSFFNSLGFKTHSIDIYNPVAKNLDTNEKLLYRGWMLKESEYKQLELSLNKQLVVSTQQYLQSHHLPNWYATLESFTMHSIYGQENNIKELYQQWGNKPAFVKDFVKSLKTGSPPIAYCFEDLQEIINNMKKYRGFIEGGIVLRDVEELNKDTETRFFVVNNKLYYKNDCDSTMIDFAQKVSEKIKNDIFFYSIDIVRNKSGQLFLIEIGDGQVCDSVGWNLHEFCQIFNDQKPSHKFKYGKI